MIDFATGVLLGQTRRTQLQPEKRLMLAVLEGAVSDFQKYATALDGRGRRLFAEADAWFQSSAIHDPLDFENVCQALDLDPSFIREGLERWCVAKRREPVHSVFPASMSLQGGHV